MADKIDEGKLLRMLSDPTTSRTAFAALVNQYGQQLYWVIRRMVLDHEDANDVLQNTFLKAWANLGDFRGKSKLLTWLYRIAVNESLDFLRKKKTAVCVGADDPTDVASTLIAETYFDGDMTQAKLQEAIAQLPDVQRQVFVLRYFDEMKYSQMSKLLGTSEGALKASYHIAVRKITDFFKGRGLNLLGINQSNN